MPWATPEVPPSFSETTTSRPRRFHPMIPPPEATTVPQHSRPGTTGSAGGLEVAIREPVENSRSALGKGGEGGKKRGEKDAVEEEKGDATKRRKMAGKEKSKSKSKKKKKNGWGGGKEEEKKRKRG